MPAPFDFPGHYWDEAKGKFFKIESSGTAPAGAQWSREEVAFSRQRERLADGPSRSRRRRQQSRPAKRTRVASRGPSDGSDEDNESDTPVGDGLTVLPSRACTRLTYRWPFLGRETGDVRTPAGAAMSSGRCFEPSLRTSAAVWYARELMYKGTVPVLDEQFALGLERALDEDGGGDGGGRRERALGPFTAALAQPKVLSGTNITCMYVQPDPGPPGLGIVYTNYDSAEGSSIKGQYIMTDDGEFISRSWPDRPPLDKYRAYERSRPEKLAIGKPSTISYHASSRLMIVTAASVRADEPCLQVFSPHVDEDAVRSSSSDGVSWLLGSTRTANPCLLSIGPGEVGAHSINACVPSPSGSGAWCVLGTDRGITVVDIGAGGPPPTGPSSMHNTAFVPLRRHCEASLPNMRLRLTPLYAPARHQNRLPKPRRHAGGAQSGFVASLDFVNRHPALVVAGGRFAAPWLVDLRQQSRRGNQHKTEGTWRPFGAFTPDNDDDDDDGASGRPSAGAGRIWAAAHVRSVSDHHVVVAGLRNTMVMYDLRYLRPSPTQKAAGMSTVVEPLFRFSNYYNTDRLTGLGFAVDTQLGIVAAAEEHAPYTGLGGGVGLFSLATGERLAAPWLKHALCHTNETLARIYPSLATSQPTITITTIPAAAATARRTVAAAASAFKIPCIPALSFAELPGEGSPSLFAGIGADVYKYSARWTREDVLNREDDDIVLRILRGRQTVEPGYGHEVMSLDAEY